MPLFLSAPPIAQFTTTICPKLNGRRVPLQDFQTRLNAAYDADDMVAVKRTTAEAMGSGVVLFQPNETMDKRNYGNDSATVAAMDHGGLQTYTSRVAKRALWPLPLYLTAAENLVRDEPSCYHGIDFDENHFPTAKISIPDILRRNATGQGTAGHFQHLFVAAWTTTKPRPRRGGLAGTPPEWIVRGRVDAAGAAWLVL